MRTKDGGYERNQLRRSIRRRGRGKRRRGRGKKEKRKKEEERRRREKKEMEKENERRKKDGERKERDKKIGRSPALSYSMPYYSTFVSIAKGKKRMTKKD